MDIANRLLATLQRKMLGQRATPPRQAAPQNTSATEGKGPLRAIDKKTSDCRHQHCYVSYSYYVKFVTLLGTRVRKRQN